MQIPNLTELAQQESQTLKAQHYLSKILIGSLQITVSDIKHFFSDKQYIFNLNSTATAKFSAQHFAVLLPNFEGAGTKAIKEAAPTCFDFLAIGDMVSMIHHSKHRKHAVTCRSKTIYRVVATNFLNRFLIRLL